jgi:hypothetical protein
MARLIRRSSAYTTIINAPSSKRASSTAAGFSAHTKHRPDIWIPLRMSDGVMAYWRRNVRLK